jgi:Fe-S-cluster-containing dehydrogenase component
MMRALLCSWRRCTGCRACELACARLGLARGDQGALALGRVGPWRLPDGAGLLEYVPCASERCHLCAPRRHRGLPPACVAHCPTRCLALVEGEEALRAALASDGHFPWLPMHSLPAPGGDRPGGP